MFNLRVSGIIAGAAFIVSFLLGLLSGTSVPMLIIRPVIFGVIFFIISGVIYLLANNFLPELFDESALEGDHAPLPGSRIDITEGDSAVFAPDYGSAAPGRSALGAQPDDSEEGLGNIADLLAKGAGAQASGGGRPAGLDQNAKNSYTANGGLEDLPVPEPLPPEEPLESLESASGPGVLPAAPAEKQNGQSGDFLDSVDVLPDLDSMAGAFLPGTGGGEPDAAEYSVSGPSKKPLSGSKSPGWAGDFNAKDMAAGLRTVINKDKEG